jgi:vitamin B12 transporter
MRLKLSLWSFLSLWVSVSAFGDDGNDSQIETITVSALPIMIDEAGSSVSIINREDILLKNVATLQELLREVPGFSVSQQGSHGAITQVRVRGAEANQVLVLIDGIEMNDISQGSEVDFSNILTHDIERIEIVRGPQSSLWGNDAVAGVIHIITRPQGASDPSLAINAEGGSFGTTRVGATLTHATTRARVKFTATTLSTDGTDISRANISGAGSEDDGYENTTIGLTGSYDISDELRGAVTVRYTDATTEFDDIDFFTTGLPVDADFETDSEYLYAGVRLDHDINESMSQSLSLARTDTDNETTTANPVADITRGVKDALRYQLNMTRDAHRISLLAEHETEDYQQRGAASFF